MVTRKRFLSIWNGIATIIFLAGIFLGFSFGGYSAFIIALFMWIISTTVANIIFGEEESDDKLYTGDKTIEVTKQEGYGKEYIEPVCPSCGAKATMDSKYCAECGTVIEKPAK